MILFRLLGELPYDRAHRIIDDASDVVSESTSRGNPVTLNTIMAVARTAAPTSADGAMAACRNH
jgi:hypothetical protein